MGLIIKKSKRETVSYGILALAILGIIINLGFVPLMMFISSQQNEQTQISPYPGLIIASLLIYISVKLKNDNSWFSKTYERLGAGTLLLLLLFSVWFLLPALGALIEHMVKNR